MSRNEYRDINLEDYRHLVDWFKFSADRADGTLKVIKRVLTPAEGTILKSIVRNGMI